MTTPEIFDGLICLSNVRVLTGGCFLNDYAACHAATQMLFISASLKNEGNDHKKQNMIILSCKFAPGKILRAGRSGCLKWVGTGEILFYELLWIWLYLQHPIKITEFQKNNLCFYPIPIEKIGFAWVSILDGGSIGKWIRTRTRTKTQILHVWPVHDWWSCLCDKI